MSNTKTYDILTHERDNRLCDLKILFSDEQEDYIFKYSGSASIGVYSNECGEVIDLCYIADVPDLIKALELMVELHDANKRTIK